MRILRHLLIAGPAATSSPDRFSPYDGGAYKAHQDTRAELPSFPIKKSDCLSIWFEALGVGIFRQIFR